MLMAVQAWENVHPLLKVIPADWRHSIPYGLPHSENPSDTVRWFPDAVQRCRKNHCVCITFG